MARDPMINILANLTDLGRNLEVDILSQCEFVH
jgi:hypothetical protein